MVTVNKREGESCLSIRTTEGDINMEDKEGERRTIQEMERSNVNGRQEKIV